MAEVASTLHGDAVPTGVDANMLKCWLLQHRMASENLRVEMGLWVKLLYNGLPSYASYQAVNASCILAADKNPGIHPLACGEVWTQCWAACNLANTRVGAKNTCGNVQLCAGLEAAIELNLSLSCLA